MQRKNGLKFAIRIAVLCMAFVLLTGTVLAEGVVPSREEYTLSFAGVDEVFISNARPIGTEVGQEVYLTYTVDRVRADHGSVQHGVVATDAPEIRYPYIEGGVICYSEDAPLLQQGYTYFFKFTYTEDGFDYVIAKAKDGTSQWVWLDTRIGEETDLYTHFGVWLAGGNVSVRLTHVRCYDRYGNDLGVFAPKHRDSLLDDATRRQKNEGLDHSYSITVDNATNVVLSNAKGTSAETVYMEYTVEESSDTKIYQTGLINHHAPFKKYPHDGAGYLLFEMDDKNPGPGYLLQEGASYVITFKRMNGQLLTLVQRTLNGNVEFKEFTNVAGTYTEADPYYALWFGEGANYPVNCKLVEFKCYDENNNNLGVQSNDKNELIKIEHFGELEDYAGCEAVYYNAQSQNTVMLYADQTAKVTRNGKSQSTTYKIKNDVLTLNFGDRTEEFAYFYQQFTAEDGAVYVRLGQYFVEFVTGTDAQIETVTVDAQSGYMVAPPEDPEKKGADFEGWHLSDGTAYDFSSVVDRSMTLYAKWSDDPDFQILTSTGRPESDDAAGWVTAVAVSAVLLAAGVTVSAIVLKKGKKHEKTGE